MFFFFLQWSASCFAQLYLTWLTNHMTWGTWNNLFCLSQSLLPSRLIISQLRFVSYVHFRGCGTGMSCSLHRVEQWPRCFVPQYAGEGDTRADGTTGESNKRMCLPCRLNRLFHIFPHGLNTAHTHVLNQPLNWKGPAHIHDKLLRGNPVTIVESKCAWVYR